MSTTVNVDPKQWSDKLAGVHQTALKKSQGSQSALEKGKEGELVDTGRSVDAGPDRRTSQRHRAGRCGGRVRPPGGADRRRHHRGSDRPGRQGEGDVHLRGQLAPADLDI